jgi:Uncharacterized protein conserved in bacteria
MRHQRKPFCPLPLPEKTRNDARYLRSSRTEADSKLWSISRKNQPDHRSRRQHPIPLYIIDFFCVELRLAIEIDGGQHAEPGKRQADLKHTQFLSSQGITVLRFWNNEVLENIEGVILAIVDACKRRPPHQPS